MSEGTRLGMLKVRISRHDSIAMFCRSAQHNPYECQYFPDDFDELISHINPPYGCFVV